MVAFYAAGHIHGGGLARQVMPVVDGGEGMWP